ncbi:hypothetical protein [Ammoniphilus sp. 3BR4]|uniref:hypothetical protein n=1 Tax=Ammoniphilus sp. 3BR4 TaxID=3158265 RepID=UPI0034676595
MERSVDESFKPMLKVKINSGQIDVDTRDEAYWKVNSFTEEHLYYLGLKRSDADQKK